MTREEGVARLWRGFEPTVLRAMAMNVGQLATYDQAKAALVKIGGDTTAMQVWLGGVLPESAPLLSPSLVGTAQLSASAIAGLTCVVTSLPFVRGAVAARSRAAAASPPCPPFAHAGPAQDAPPKRER